MKRFAWYSLELDVIVLQAFIEGCYIGFQWELEDMYEISEKFGIKHDLMECALWFPLGEI
jgi:hypothetical protein